VQLLRRLVTGKARWPLYLHGPAGSGKTLAALCLCDVTIQAVYQTVEQISDVVFQPGEWIWRAARERELCVLDELGARQNVTDPHYQAVKKFADARELYANRVAVYISNLRPKELVKVYDDRIASRMLCGELFCLEGEDRRRV
jgi:DNA replication protein DnaC